MGKSDTNDLANQMSDNRKFPMEITTGIINTLEESFGFNLVSCADVRKNGVDNFQTQQIWTLSSSNKMKV